MAAHISGRGAARTEGGAVSPPPCAGPVLGRVATEILDPRSRLAARVDAFCAAHPAPLLVIELAPGRVWTFTVFSAAAVGGLLCALDVNEGEAGRLGYEPTYIARAVYVTPRDALPGVDAERVDLLRPEPWR